VAWFRCFVVGENFPDALVNRPGVRMGFYTTRVVEASSPGHAERVVLALLRNDPDFRIDEDMPEADLARISLELIDEVGRDTVLRQDAAWFPMEDNEIDDVPFGLTPI